MKNIQDALARLAAIETEAQKLREIIEAPEQVAPARTPEAGDVWTERYGADFLCNSDGTNTILNQLHGGYPAGKLGTYDFDKIGRTCTYLGKFSEVYVKRDDFIRDVRDALSIEDKDGDSVLAHSGVSTTTTQINTKGTAAIAEALAELGIK